MEFEKKDNLAGRCETFKTSAYASKDCYTSCKGALCNKDLSIANYFEPELGTPRVEKCYTCALNEFLGLTQCYK